MPKYIDAEAAIGKFPDIEPAGFGYSSAFVRKTLEDMPAAEVEPMKHSRWLDGAEKFTCGLHNAECSICGANISWSGCDEDFNYCPNCGAKMDKGITT